MKDQIMRDIVGRLKDLQIRYTVQGSTVTVAEEFVEIGESSDLKKVHYDLVIGLDEASRSVVTYVSAADTHIITADGKMPPEEPDRPATLFRKVRHVLIDDSGDSSLITLDLAELPAIAKDCAARHGWRFATVLNMTKKDPPVLLSASEHARSIQFHDELDNLALADLLAVESGDVPKRSRHARKKGGFFSRLFGRKKK